MEDNPAETASLVNDSRSRDLLSEDQPIHDFLVTHSKEYQELYKTREEGRNNPEGDSHFKNQRKFADEANYKARLGFFNLMKRVGDKNQETTGVLTLPKPGALVLDICMALGGYSASTLRYSPHAQIRGISLPPEIGGHQIILSYGYKDPRVQIRRANVTILVAEFGLTGIPENHPEKSKFSFDRPWLDEKFDLVICGGQVLLIHHPHIADYRDEAMRLLCSQLVLAMQRIQQGGTFIMLLHKIEAWKTAELLALFDQISQLRLFKSKTSHKSRSPFYLIAQNVQPDRDEARAAVEEWKDIWKSATFPASGEQGSHDASGAVDKEHDAQGEVSNYLAKSGERLTELEEPFWQIQKEALKETKRF